MATATWRRDPEYERRRGGDSDFSSPGERGQLVRSNGRDAVFVRDFENGKLVVTFVIWA